MTISIALFFQCAHYVTYMYLVGLAYKRFIRPYLRNEQNRDRALMLQLQQKLAHGHEVMQLFRQQVDYLQGVLVKISQQQKQAQYTHEQLWYEQQQKDLSIKAQYREQQQVVAYNRQLAHTCQEIAPKVLHELRLELKQYAQEHGQQYLARAIKALKEQSHKQSTL